MNISFCIYIFCNAEDMEQTLTLIGELRAIGETAYLFDKHWNYFNN